MRNGIISLHRMGGGGAVWGVGTGTLSKMKMIDVRGWSFVWEQGLCIGR